MSNWNYKLIVGEVTYQFDGIEDDPLRFIMKIDENNFLIRDINCDVPRESWQLVYKYIGVDNRKEVEKIYNKIVYNGKEITDDVFLENLLLHVLAGLVNPLDS